MTSFPVGDHAGFDHTTTDLVVVDHHKLWQGDAIEAAKLYSACVDRGFFYLDLENGSSDSTLQNVDQLFQVTKEYFAMPLDQKMKDTRSEIDVFHICGYKPLGIDQGNVQSQKDGCEGLRLPLDLFQEEVINPRLAMPNGVRKHQGIVAKFTEGSFAICDTMLKSLSQSMGLEGEKRLQLQHQKSAPSTSGTVLQCYPVENLPPNTSQGHFAHTDSGSISVLFVSDWGLQVYSSKHEKWESISPRTGCAIVNVGDSLRYLSNLTLKSSLHRVVPLRARQTSGPRYSIAFFLRPNDTAKFIDAEGTQWDGKGWVNSKFLNYRRKHEEQEKTSMATGQKGFLGLLQE